VASDYGIDRVTLIQRLAFEGLEPCDGKLSCRVLRGLGGSNDARLPGQLTCFSHPLYLVPMYNSKQFEDPDSK